VQPSASFVCRCRTLVRRSTPSLRPSSRRSPSRWIAFCDSATAAWPPRAPRNDATRSTESSATCSTPVQLNPTRQATQRTHRKTDPTDERTVGLHVGGGTQKQLTPDFQNLAVKICFRKVQTFGLKIKRKPKRVLLNSHFGEV